jgi:hypothetical protein|tara:strand:+ start:393 stop:617 length:225 start_codon:yes stop_codon:yes gene_type:complete
MQSVEFKVLEVAIPKHSSMCLMQAGILVASPTNSTEWSLVLSTPIKDQVSNQYLRKKIFIEMNVEGTVSIFLQY